MPFGPVTHSGTGTSGLTLVWGGGFLPLPAYQLAVLVTEGGNVADGTCEIALALDANLTKFDGQSIPTFQEEIVIPASGLYPVPGANFSLQFDPTGTLVLDDTYSAQPLSLQGNPAAAVEQFAAFVIWRLLWQGIGEGWAFAFGAENIEISSAPPRLLFVAPDDVFGPARGLAKNPRRRRTQHAGFEVHCWHVDRGSTEAMAKSVQDSVYQVAFGTFRLLKGTWPAERGEKRGVTTNAGFVYVFTFTAEIPVLDPARITGQVTSVPFTPTLYVGIPPEPDTG